jgi:hypothetical protein
VGITIKVATLDFKITVKNNDFTKRELDLIEVLILNIINPANAFVTGTDMFFNPLSKSEDQDEVFNFQFAWQNSLEKEVYEEFVETIDRRVNTAFKMLEIENVTISSKENSFANNN